MNKVAERCRIMTRIEEIAARLNDRHDNASWNDIAYLLEE